jgi:hypothetical protein
MTFALSRRDVRSLASFALVAMTPTIALAMATPIAIEYLPVGVSSEPST